MPEWLRDLGRRAMGQGDRVHFKHEAREYARLHGMSEVAAHKALLGERISTLRNEFMLRGAIDRHQNESLKQLNIALYETLGAEAVKQCRQDALNPTLNRPLSLPPPNTFQIGATEAYFTRQYGAVPDFTVTENASRQMMRIASYAQRFGHDPRLGAPQDLAWLVAHHRDLGADLGRFLLAQDTLALHEHQFKRERAFQTSLQELGTEAQEQGSLILWRAPVEFAGSLFGAVGTIVDGRFFLGFSRALLGCGQFATREAKALTTLGARALKTGVHYLNTKFKI